MCGQFTTAKTDYNTDSQDQLQHCHNNMILYKVQQWPVSKARGVYFEYSGENWNEEMLQHLYLWLSASMLTHIFGLVLVKTRQLC